MMFDGPLFLAFLAAATLLTLTPGVDTAMVLRFAAAEGARSAMAAGVGIVLGCLVWGAVVAAGLGAVLLASPVAFLALKGAGAVYLCWLGAKLILRPRDKLAAPGAMGSTDVRTALRRGLVTNLLNPKVGVFYVTFLPQFIPAEANVAVTAFGLAAIHAGLGLIWFAVLIAATVPVGRFLRRPRVIQTLDRLTGGVFIAFGVKLALTRA